MQTPGRVGEILVLDVTKHHGLNVRPEVLPEIVNQNPTTFKPFTRHDDTISFPHHPHTQINVIMRIFFM